MARLLLTVAFVGAAVLVDGFSLTASPLFQSCSASRRATSVPSLKMQLGFGKKEPERKLSEVAKDRKAAAERYEAIKQGGAPEFNVFFRKVGAGDEDGLIKGGWYPVGVITAPSSQLVNKAIFNTEDALLQGAFRVHQKQIMRQFTTRDGRKCANWKDMKECDIEYGYQMKDFPDEEVKKAEKPREPSELEKWGGGFLKKLQDGINWVPDQDK